MAILTLSVSPAELAIHRFSAGSNIDHKAFEAEFFSLTKTKEELSLVVPADVKLDSDKVETGWRCLKVEGPLDFGLTGILAGISKILANAEVSIFAISTYDTDYILVKEEKLELACQILKENDYNII